MGDWGVRWAIYLRTNKPSNGFANWYGPLRRAERKHMSKRDLALDSLTRICEIQQRLINQLIAMEQNSYARGHEDGMVAQAEVEIVLNEMKAQNENHSNI